MRKLLRFLDENIVKIGVAFLLLFVPLYPKLPSVHIIHTWVYIRLEDFFILLVVLIWLIQLLRKKVSFNWSVEFPILLYWIAGFLSLLFSLIILAPHLANFFPTVAALSYFRRIEYMILFFVAISTIKSKKDLKDYLIILCVSIFGVVFYGIGQKEYLLLWSKFPQFFEKYSFCFPSVQTGNEEFAKGQLLCLPSDARVTSTFGGHYDLGAYLVFMIPLLAGLSFSVKRRFTKIALFIFTILSLIVLLFTASRVSFTAYLFGITGMLIFAKKKKFIPVALIISFVLLFAFNGSTAKRFLQTIRFTSIVVNSQGKIVGESVPSIPVELQKKIAKEPVVTGVPVTQDLPPSSVVVALPPVKTQTATTSAVVKSNISPDEARKLKLTNGGIEISTVSGSFLLQKALVYDISFTTRFQAEWPNAWKAFLRNPLLGSGYSTITLATDGDYLRFLGESGALGLLSFLFIFLIFAINYKHTISSVSSKTTRYALFGIAGGMIGLFFNGLFIDVFEASKVAESVWIVLGIGLGALLLYRKETINYPLYIKQFLKSNILISIYLLIVGLVLFLPSIHTFFIGDDFTWLRWAATSSVTDIKTYFTDATGFFYRPLDKVVIFILYAFLSFNPEGYHLFIIFIHILISIGIFFLLLRFTKGNKLFSFIVALLFIGLPAHGENLYWISTISVIFSTFWIVYSLLLFTRYLQNGKVINYVFSFIFAIAAFFSYEMAVVLPFLLLLADYCFTQERKIKKKGTFALPFFILIPCYYFIRNLSHAFSGGGDYSYNLGHFIPNFFANLFGYFGLFLVGDPIFPIYTALRASLRSFAVIVTVVLILICVGLFVLIFQKRKKIQQWFTKQKNTSLIVFALGFIFVGFLPFIGFGDMTQRYGYLPSIGFAILLTSGIFILTRVITANNKQSFSICLTGIIIFVLAIYKEELFNESKEWQYSAIVTRQTLAIFRIDYPTLPQYANLYFVNTPIKKGQSWIFPVGLQDGLWFIYRDPTLHIYDKVGSLDEAKALKAQSEKTTLIKNYIFKFDDKGEISEIKSP